MVVTAVIGDEAPPWAPLPSRVSPPDASTLIVPTLITAALVVAALVLAALVVAALVVAALVAVTVPGAVPITVLVAVRVRSSVVLVGPGDGDDGAGQRGSGRGEQPRPGPVRSIGPGGSEAGSWANSQARSWPRLALARFWAPLNAERQAQPVEVVHRDHLALARVRLDSTSAITPAHIDTSRSRLFPDAPVTTS